MEFHSRYLYMNEALLNCDRMLEDISFKVERCHCSFPGCSNSSSFIDMFFWSRLDINRRYWPNFCTAALCWGPAGPMGYGQGMVDAPQAAGAVPSLAGGRSTMPSKLSREKDGRAGGQRSPCEATATRQVLECSEQSAVGQSRNSDQWRTWPGAGMV